MPLERLEKKIGDLASPSLNNGSGHDPLNDIANVRNKFNNLKKKTFIPKSVVSKSVYDKLTSLDIKTVGDVLARGHVEMEAITNTATVSKIDAFMRTMGLSLFPRIREESEASFNARDDDEKEFVILSNLTYNFTRVPSSTLGIAVPCVCGLDGSFVGPEEWKTLKEELKGNPLWDDVSASDEYAFLKDDEDRLAGEVLAKLVGSKGEELLLKAARGAVREGGAVDEADIKKTVEGFRKGLSETAIKDVFGIGELDGASKATLKVLKDFVDCGTGTGMEKNSTVSERNGAVAGYSSSDGLSYHRQGAPKPSSLNSMNDVTNIQKNTDYIKRKIKEYRNEHNIVIRRNSENELVRTISRYFNFQKSRSSNPYYQDYFEGDVEYNGKTVRIRISQHPANKDRMCGLPVDDIVSIVIYRIPLRNLGK